MYKSYKRYDNISVCHRNYHAAKNTERDSFRCSLIHGYARSIELEFAADVLDDKGWVYDFGNCRTFKKWLDDNYDHCTLISSSDPLLDDILSMEKLGLLRVTVIDDVDGHNPSIEGSAKHLFDVFNTAIRIMTGKEGAMRNLRISKVTIWEHSSNFASYTE